MGAFHQGHLDLMRLARQECDRVIVSLFVNPTQFGPREDFARYPRDEARDASLAESVGVDLLYCPTVETVYPRRTTTVHVDEVTKLWEGASRPGHFDGVATVVLKLFHMTRPHRAYFGQKDLQQCAVIRRMVEDLDVPVDLQIVPTTREPDGLAMSSRNVYLSREERAVAPILYETLTRSAKRLTELSAEAETVLQSARSQLATSGFQLDYLAWIDRETFQEVRRPQGPTSLIVAARLGNTRLIDNVPVSEP